MYFVLMIHAEEGAPPAPAETDGPSMMEAVDTFDRELTEAGKNIGSIRLHAANGGKVVRVRKRRAMVTDGPFADTKEQLGGLYFVEADNLDEAVEIAKKLPTATFATIEVRQAAGVDLRKEVQYW